MRRSRLGDNTVYSFVDNQPDSCQANDLRASNLSLGCLASARILFNVIRCHDLSFFSVSLLMLSGSVAQTIGPRKGLQPAIVTHSRGEWSKQRPDLRNEPARPQTSLKTRRPACRLSNGWRIAATLEQNRVTKSLRSKASGAMINNLVVLVAIMPRMMIRRGGGHEDENSRCWHQVMAVMLIAILS